jgi:hypothetical protein
MLNRFNTPHTGHIYMPHIENGVVSYIKAPYFTKDAPYTLDPTKVLILQTSMGADAIVPMVESKHYL